LATLFLKGQQFSNDPFDFGDSPFWDFVVNQELFIQNNVEELEMLTVEAHDSGYFISQNSTRYTIRFNAEGYPTLFESKTRVYTKSPWVINLMLNRPDWETLTTTYSYNKNFSLTGLETRYSYSRNFTDLEEKKFVYDQNGRLSEILSVESTIHKRAKNEGADYIQHYQFFYTTDQHITHYTMNDLKDEIDSISCNCPPNALFGKYPEYTEIALNEDRKTSEIKFNEDYLYTYKYFYEKGNMVKRVFDHYRRKQKVEHWTYYKNGLVETIRTEGKDEMLIFRYTLKQ
jgi:hypothetical protein